MTTYSQNLKQTGALPTHRRMCNPISFPNGILKAFSSLMKDGYVVPILLVVAVLMNVDTCFAKRKLSFETFPLLESKLPTQQVKSIYRDKSGYMWIATENGLFRYDGYSVNGYESCLKTPKLLTSNLISFVTEDDHDNLWIGTWGGLNILNKKSGKIFKSGNNFFKNSMIERIVIAKSGSVFIGAGKELCQYFIDKDSCRVFRSNTEKSPPSNVKGLLEDSDGLLWIGSWDNGMSCYNQSTGKFVKYPKIGNNNSAHVIFEDSRKRLWVGTWGEGVVMLENKSQLDPTKWKWFKHVEGDNSSIQNNIIYAINEDPTTGDIWIGSRGGLSVIDRESGEINNYYPNSNQLQFSINEVNSIVTNNGEMWLGMLGGGVCRAYVDNNNFNRVTFENISTPIPTHQIRSIYVADNGLVYGALFNNGIIIYDKERNTLVRSLEKCVIGSFATIKSLDEIWMPAYADGVYIQKANSPQFAKLKLEITNICDCLEDNYGTKWLVSRNNLFFLDEVTQRAVAVKTRKEFLYEFSKMAVDKKNRIWIATNNGGVLRVDESLKKNESTFSYYDTDNGKVEGDDIKVITIDSNGRVWIGTEGYGLMCFDESQDKFISINKLINFPFDHISSITEDLQGNLWIGTNSGLVNFTPTAKLKDSRFVTYTTSDGLKDNNLTSAAYFDRRSGIMYVGSHKGFIWFYPQKVHQASEILTPVISDIRIAGISWNDLKEPLKSKISHSSPEYCSRIVLPYSSKNLTLEFASLDLGNRTPSKYIYKLEGFDDNWLSTINDNHSVTYNNLPSGNYRFRVKVVNRTQNDLDGDEKVVQIEVLPPLWLSWWAMLGYFTVFFVVAYIAIRTTKNRLALLNQIKLQKIEREQIENLNQAKIQFFTNITHEFLTPLTVIIASIDELKTIDPRRDKQYNVVINNANKLIRLLQQILEFRKSDTGNLKLKVSKGDVVGFIRNSYENLLPLLKRKDLNYSFICAVDNLEGWFDTDKVDKIIYNLVSNAVKYSNEGGDVRLQIDVLDDGRAIRLDVVDNGQGISEDELDTIFERFHDGEYRRHKTYGYGIGLSLVKALAQLHGGHVSVRSQLGNGSVFSVTIPISADAFNASEYDHTMNPDVQSYDSLDSKVNADITHTILVVEDETEIRDLVKRIFAQHYKVLVANDGDEAVQIVKSSEIDVIVSDVMMPNMSGIELTSWVKSNLDFCHIPVILLTAKNSEEDRVESYECGADGFITKPFSRSVLLAKIKNLLRAKERSARDFRKQFLFEAKDLNFTSMDQEFITKATECVHKNLTNPEFEQMQFVEQMFVSRSTLYRKITSLTGMNPSAFIRNVRLKEACRIIQTNPTVRIAEVAYAVGFNDPKYFSSCFKKEFGILPTDFAEQFSN